MKFKILPILILLFSFLLFWQNNKEVNAQTRIFGPYDSVNMLNSDLNLASENSWSFVYSNNGQEYVKIEDNYYGPYKNTYLSKSNKNWIIKYERNYNNNTDYFFNVNGQDYGPYNNIVYIGAIDDVWLAIYTDKDNHYFIKVNDIDFGPFDNIGNIAIKGNNYGFGYLLDDKYYYHIKKLPDFGPFDKPSKKLFLSISDKNWAFTYEEAGKYYINKNYTSHGPYNYIFGLDVSDDMWGFIYLKENDILAKINDKVFGPFDDINNIKIHKNNFAFSFKKGSYYYFNVNGIIYEKYKLVSDIIFSDNNWAFNYAKIIGGDLKTYVQTKNKIFGPYDHVSSIAEKKSLSNRYLCFIYDNNGKSFIKINKKDFGPFQRIIDFDVSDNAWGFLYQENNDYFINFKNEIAGPFKKVNNFSIKGDNLSFIYQDENDKNKVAIIQHFFKLKNSQTEYEQEKYNIINLQLFQKLKGRIILKTEDKGKAYYVNIDDKSLYFLGRPQNAFEIMKKKGIGISNKDLTKIPVALLDDNFIDSDNDGLSDALEESIGSDKNKIDTDNDGYNDKEELLNGYSLTGKNKIIFDNKLTQRLSGKILLQVEKNGEAWYLNPLDKKRYFLGRPQNAFNIMRKLSLGISNNDFSKLVK